MIEYKIDKAQKIIFVTITKSITSDEIVVHISDIMNDPGFSYDYNSVIFINENLIIPQIKAEKIEGIQEIINGYANIRKGTKWAVVVSKETKHEMVQKALDLISPLSANIRLFHDTNKAIAWIKD